MGVALDVALSEMATHSSSSRSSTKRDHRLAIALLTKSRYKLPHPSTSPPGTEGIAARLGDADKQSWRRPPLCPPVRPGEAAALPTSGAGERKKRPAEALSTFTALQASGVKRQRILPKRSVASDGENASRRDRAWQVIASRGDATGLPRSLHFALQGLSSADALALKRIVLDLPQTIARLNARHRPAAADAAADSTLVATTKVFGWRNYFLRQLAPSSGATDRGSRTVSPRAEYTTTSVVWKAVKTFESTAMQPLAQRVWDSAHLLARDSAASNVSSFEVLHAISATVRVVKLVDALHGRRELETVWVECFLEAKDHVCIARRQLADFRDYHLDGESAGKLECEGFLFRPHLTKLSAGDGTLMLGSTLQRVSSVTCRDALSPAALVQSIVADLPRSTLQWEEVVVHDLLPQISF